jgi:hypothetical protein
MKTLILENVYTKDIGAAQIEYKMCEYKASLNKYLIIYINAGG